MTTTDLQKRVDELESDLARRISELDERIANLAQHLVPLESEQPPWWKQIIGIYRNNPDFDEADKLGREYRDSQQHLDEGTHF